MSKIISLDFDDTLYDLMSLNVEYIENKFGVSNVVDKIESYYWLWENYPTIADDLWNHPENYIKGELIAGAKTFYKLLVKELGVDKIQIVTSSMRDIVERKNVMIKNLGFDCDVVHSIFNGEFPKSFYTFGTVLIDDHTENVKDHIYKNNNYGIVFNHMKLPYIKNQAKEHNLRYVETFEELVGVLILIDVLRPVSSVFDLKQPIEYRN